MSMRCAHAVRFPSRAPIFRYSNLVIHREPFRPLAGYVDALQAMGYLRKRYDCLPSRSLFYVARRLAIYIHTGRMIYVFVGNIRSHTNL
jgi:hypothetical protein